MELLIKSESEKIAKQEQDKRRRQRLIQVRQQASHWMVKKRTQYQAKKSDQLQEIIEEAAKKREEEFVTAIKNMSKSHLEGMEQIGDAHRAAQLINAMNLPEKAEAEKRRRDKIARKRHANALKARREAEAKSDEAKFWPRLLKEEVRRNEDLVAKELVIMRPYQAPLAVAETSKTGKKSDKVYPKSPTKYLHVPGREKTPKKKPRSKLTVSVSKKSEVRKQTKTYSAAPSVFGMVASEVKAGVTPPVIKKVHESPAKKLKPSVQNVRDSQKRKGDISQVTYFDASIPLPPIHYKAPPGLVQPASMESNAWIDGEKLNKEAQLIEEKKLLDIRERERRAHIRGQKALRIARLQQRYKQLEADLLEENQVQGFQPILESSQRKSMLDLEVVPEKTGSDDVDKRRTQEELPKTFSPPTKLPSVTTPLQGAHDEEYTSNGHAPNGLSLSYSSATATRTNGSMQFLDIEDSDREDGSVKLLTIVRNGRNVKSETELELKEPEASTLTEPESLSTPESLGERSQRVESSSESCMDAMAIEISIAPAGAASTPTTTDSSSGLRGVNSSIGTSTSSSTSNNYSYSDLITTSYRDLGAGGDNPLNPVSRMPHESDTSSSIHLLSLSTTTSQETGSSSTSGMNMAPSVNNSSSTSTSTMAVVNIVCSPRHLASIPHDSLDTTDSSLSEALNRICLNQGSAQLLKNGQQRKEESMGQRETSGSSESEGTSTLLSQARKLLNPDKENLKQIFKPPSCSSIRSDSSSNSKEVNRGVFGTNLGNTLYSSSPQSEKPTFELNPVSSVIQKLTSEWSKVTIEKPSWWGSPNGN